jgi:hypothetical protein
VPEALRFVRFPAPFPGHRPASGAPWPWVVRVAVVVSVLATVASDIAAGAAAGHVLTLGLVASAVAVIRVRSVGHLGGLWRWVSAGLIAQPILHDAADLAADAMRSTDSGQAGVATVVLSALAQTVVAGAIVAAVSLVERVFAARAGRGGVPLRARHVPVRRGASARGRCPRPAAGRAPVPPRPVGGQPHRAPRTAPRGCPAADPAPDRFRCVS